MIITTKFSTYLNITVCDIPVILESNDFVFQDEAHYESPCVGTLPIGACYYLELHNAITSDSGVWIWLSKAQ